MKEKTKRKKRSENEFEEESCLKDNGKKFYFYLKDFWIPKDNTINNQRDRIFRSFLVNQNKEETISQIPKCERRNY